MSSMETIPRAYIRHPASVPIDIRAGSPDEQRRLRDIGLGGLSCFTPNPLVVGDLVVITIPVTDPPFEACGEVVWCRRAEEGFEVGIQFMTPSDAFTARMVEQVCHIEQYREEVLRKEGRKLEPDAAAKEWISKYAGDFPDPRLMH